MEKHIGPSVDQVETSKPPTHTPDQTIIPGKTLEQAAEQGTIDEKELNVRDAIAAYPSAILWSLVFSTCVIMEGYDTNLLSNFFAYREY
jgi:MFS transporter, SP family, general alpha glucoside:H+ symporter